MLGSILSRFGLPGFSRKFSESPLFRAAVDKAFDEVDVDLDGRLDSKELFIGLLRLYDILNSKLPCHIKVPDLREVRALAAKYDANSSGFIERAEFKSLCAALIGTRKDWRDSLLLKITVAVAAKAVGFPALSLLIKAAAGAGGWGGMDKVPNGALAFALEQVAKQVVPM